MSSSKRYPNVEKYVSVVCDEYSELLETLCKLYNRYTGDLPDDFVEAIERELASAEDNIKRYCTFSTETYTTTYEQEVVSWDE